MSGNLPLFVVRLGLAFVFLWFGVSKILFPESWIAWLPQWMLDIPLSANANLVLQGIAEAGIGLLLLVGFLTRFASAAAALLLAAVIFTIGFSNEVAVRDFAILTMAVSLILSPEHPFSVDSRRKKKRETEKAVDN